MKQRTRIIIDARELITDKSKWWNGHILHLDPTRRDLTGAIASAARIHEKDLDTDSKAKEVVGFLSHQIRQRKDGETKLNRFMTQADKDHCLVDSDWIAAFNDNSQHKTVIRLLDEAIAASEPCEECEATLTADDCNLVTVEDNPEKILCGHCAMFAQYPEDDEYQYDTTPPPVQIIREES